MPVATLVTVPTSRSVRCGVNDFPHLADSGEHPVEIALEALGFHGHWLTVAGFSSSPTPFSIDAR